MSDLRAQGARRPRVLIVDDSSADRFLYERLLSGPRREFEIIETETAIGGLEAAEHRRPACIVLDYMLPDLTGNEFLRALRKRGLKMPVVMLTGERDAGVSAEAFRQGVSDYLVKGRLTLGALQRAVRQAIERQARRDTTDAPGTAAPQGATPAEFALALIRQIDDLLLLVRLDDGIIRQASPGGLAHFGYETMAAIGRPLQSLGLFGDERDWMLFQRRAHSCREAFEWPLRHNDGQVIPAEFRSKRVVVDDQEHLVLLARDITERKRHEARLRELSLLDPLTGLQNRRGFDTQLMQEWARASLAGGAVALLMIDVDCFKAYNDRLGHVRGDDCLRRIAGALRTCLRRHSDLVARFGGEEFAALLPDADMSAATAVGERMIAAVAALGISHPDSTVAAHMTVSIGGAGLVPSVDTAPIHLVDTADRALYEAKAAGRNRLILASSQEPRTVGATQAPPEPDELIREAG